MHCLPIQNRWGQLYYRLIANLKVTVMIEITLATIIITIIVVLTLRNTKQAILENPLILNRTGQYHATLAPRLNIAQVLIEAIAKQIPGPHDQSPDSAPQCFEVRDPSAVAIEQELYQLVIAIRDGGLFFQATASHSLDDNQKVSAETSPDTRTHNLEMNKRIVVAANTAAQQLGIRIRHVTLNPD